MKFKTNQQKISKLKNKEKKKKDWEGKNSSLGEQYDINQYKKCDSSHR